MSDNDLMSAENRAYAFTLAVLETGCLFKDLFTGIRWVIYMSWFLTHYNYQYLSVIRLFNKRLVPQGQE